MSILIPGCHVDRSSDLWKLYLQLREIVDFLESNFYEKQDVEVFEYNIENFIHNWAMIQDDLKPKVHIMQHLPELISEFSVLKFSSTLRLERLNRLNKVTIKESQNFTTIPLQVIKKWAMNFVQNSFQFKREIDYGRQYTVQEIPFYFSNNLINFIDVSKELSVYKNIPNIPNR